jgi:hypothetical protein
MKISNLFSESEKNWVIETSAVPIKTGGTRFEVETKVRWCPRTDEIFYQKPQKTGLFEDEWAEVTKHSDLYKRLLRSFRRKHKSQKINQTKKRTTWTQI